MSADRALLTQCAARAAALAGSLRKDQAELGPTSEGAARVGAVADLLEQIAALAEPPPNMSEPSQPK